MGKQKGTSQFTGRVGDLIFYDSPYGILVRGVGSLNKKRIAKDPSFARTRNTGTEFSRVSRGGKLLRHALKPYFPNASEHSTNYRLNRVLVTALQSEKVHDHGERLLGSADLSVLKGFEWNSTRHFTSVYKGGLQLTADKGTRIFRITTAPFELKAAIVAVKGATHVQMVVVGLAPDFEADTCASTVAEGIVWNLSDRRVEAQTLECGMDPGASGSIIFAIGLRAFKEVDGVLYGLKGGDALVIAEVV